MSNTSENVSAETLDNSFLSILREAFSGLERDLTQGSIGKAIFLLLVPMILEMSGRKSVRSGGYFVAGLCAYAIAVVGLTEALIVIVYALAIGISIGATATVARRTGEKDTEGAARDGDSGSLSGLDRFGCCRHHRRRVRAAASPADGRGKRICYRARHDFYAHNARRQCRHRVSISDKRDFSRRGRRGDCDACFVGGKHF